MSRPSPTACEFPRNGLAEPAALPPRPPAPPACCAAKAGLATTMANASTIRRRVIGIFSWQCKRKEVGAGRNRDVLLPIDGVADRRRGDQIASVEMPQRLTGARLERADLTFVLTGKHESARRRQHAWPVVERADLLVVPDLPAGRCIERPHVQLPGFLRLRALEIAAARARAIGRPENDPAPLLRDQKEVIQIGVVRW